MASDHDKRHEITRRTALLTASIGVATIFRANDSYAADKWDDTLAAANKEGELLLYSTRADSDNAMLIEAFRTKYPAIKARAIRLVSGGLITKIDLELQANALAGDVLVHSEHQWSIPKAREGRFIVPEGPSRSLWKGAEKYYADGRIQVAGEPWVIGYNTNFVKSAPVDWDSLLDNEQFRGRVGLNEVSGLTVAAWYDFVEKKKPGYFERLAKLKPQVYQNSSPLTAGLSSGEIAWAPFSLASSIEPLKAKGAPVAYTVASSGTYALQRSAMALKEAPHPNAARVLLDFLMSQDGQQILNGRKAGFSVAPGVRVSDGLEVDVSKIEDVDFTSFPVDFTRAWQAKVDKLYRT